MHNLRNQSIHNLRSIFVKDLALHDPETKQL